MAPNSTGAELAPSPMGWEANSYFPGHALYVTSLAILCAWGGTLPLYIFTSRRSENTSCIVEGNDSFGLIM